MRKFVASEDTDVEKFSDNNKIVYYVKHIDKFYANESSINIQFHLYGLIKENDAKQGLCFELENTCFDNDIQPCEIDFETKKDMGLEIMKSVKF